MSAPTSPVCFSCGQAAGVPLRLNYLSSGEVCPACRDRVLEALSPLLPGRRAAGKRARAGGRNGPELAPSHGILRPNFGASGSVGSAGPAEPA